ncbi:MAG TPA: penicillin-insensitive murein endopeptidase [Kofleriaceae bacterium]|nr:penicillin-insensitive murein endopeptidase [Kofleriaceae bacterium]
MRHSLLAGLIVALMTATGIAEAKSKGRRAAPRPTMYTVKAGEPLYRIAEKFHCSIGELRDANDLPKGRVHGGVELRIPKSCGKATKKNAAVTTKATDGQSIGAPWDGRLAGPDRLKAGKGYVIRRSGRVYGTKTTIAFVREALAGFREDFPKAHIVAVGDISAKSGGRITQHSSHQSGRDIDLGLIYKKKPAAFPTWFIKGTADNLDIAATWGLIRQFTRTTGKDGGMQVMFLDYKVQGVIYDWAKEHGVDDAVLERTFQYPRGRSSSEGLVHHEPHHDDHIHVRFQCNETDRDCH